MNGDRRVQGHCPMGCGETLFVGQGGYLTCSHLQCPRPDAASELLGDNETEHIVELREDDFVVRHPLRERLDDALILCALAHYIQGLDQSRVSLGRWRVRARPGGFWSWEAIRDRQETPLETHAVQEQP